VLFDLGTGSRILNFHWYPLGPWLFQGAVSEFSCMLEWTYPAHSEFGWTEHTPCPLNLPFVSFSFI